MGSIPGISFGDAYEITCLRLALGHNWTSYWNLIEYAFYVYDKWYFGDDQEQAWKFLAAAWNWSL